MLESRQFDSMLAKLNTPLGSLGFSQRLVLKVETLILL